MSMTPFNTYDYVKELIQGGFTEQQAEANMRALVKSLDFTIKHNLVTKNEFKEVISRLEVIEKNYVTKTEFDTAITRLEKDIHSLNHKIDHVFLKTIVSTGGMLTIACSVMTFLIKF